MVQRIARRAAVPHPLTVSARITVGRSRCRVRLVQRLDDGGEVVAADVAGHGVDLVVGQSREETVHRGIDARPAPARGQRLRAPLAGQPEQRLVLGDGHRPPAARWSASPPGRAKQRAQPRPQRSSMTRQPLAANICASWLPPRVGRDPVEALPVEVHDPQEVAEGGHRLLEQRLPHVALVELGVADHHDQAARGLVAAVDRRGSARPARRSSRPPRPSPIEPVERSTTSGFLRRLGYAWSPPKVAQAPELLGGRAARAGTGWRRRRASACALSATTSSERSASK